MTKASGALQISATKSVAGSSQRTHSRLRIEDQAVAAGDAAQRDDRLRRAQPLDRPRERWDRLERFGGRFGKQRDEEDERTGRRAEHERRGPRPARTGDRENGQQRSGQHRDREHFEGRRDDRRRHVETVGANERFDGEAERADEQRNRRGRDDAGASLSAFAEPGEPEGDDDRQCRQHQRNVVGQLRLRAAEEDQRRDRPYQREPGERTVLRARRLERADETDRHERDPGKEAEEPAPAGNTTTARAGSRSPRCSVPPCSDRSARRRRRDRRAAPRPRTTATRRRERARRRRQVRRRAGR